MTTFLKHIPLNIKMLFITILTGIVVWTILDYFQHKKLETIFHNQLNDILNKQAESNRIQFDRLIQNYDYASKIIISQKNFADYIESLHLTDNKSPDIKIYHSTPPWFPGKDVLRSFVHIRYAMLLDDNGTVRELFQDWPVPMPSTLLKPSWLLRHLSHNQSFMTEIEGLPFLITAKSIDLYKGTSQGIFMILSPLDNYFFSAFQEEETAYGNIVALLTGEDNKIVASSEPELLPFGLELAVIKEEYLVTGKSFFDYGASDLLLQFTSFISMEQFDTMTKSILFTERIQRAVTAIVIIIIFMIIIFWITRNTKLLTQSISLFCRNMDIEPLTLKRGDEFYMLKEQYEHMKHEIIESREELKRANEELESRVEERTCELKESNDLLSLEVSERKRIEEVLREKSAYLNSILSSTTDISIAATDLDLKIKYYNPVAEQIFGYKVEEVIGKTVMEIHTKENVSNERFQMAMEIVEREGTYEYTVEQKENGVSRFVQSQVYGIKENNKLLGFMLISRDITEKKQAEEQINASLREKEVLLKEIHHRVKNNMQVISGLLGLQSRFIDNTKYTEIFKESQNRIKSMALVHEKLYSTSDLSRINFKDYISTLACDLFKSYSLMAEKIVLKLEIEDIQVAVDTAIPCGLITNEVLSNSLKYAFPGERRGEITINVCTTDDNKTVILLSDNGIGIPDNIDFTKNSSLGLHLVETLVRQIRGTLDLNRNNNGTEFRITF